MMIRIKQFKKIALFIISVLLISGMVYGGVEYSIGSNSLSGTVLDESTKLRWTRCSINDSGEGDATSSCVQSHIKVTWENALITCESLDFAGINDWRLPNVRELLSIVDYSEIVLLLWKNRFFQILMTASTGHLLHLMIMQVAQMIQQIMPGLLTSNMVILILRVKQLITMFVA